MICPLKDGIDCRPELFLPRKNRDAYPCMFCYRQELRTDLYVIVSKGVPA